MLQQSIVYSLLLIWNNEKEKREGSLFYVCVIRQCVIRYQILMACPPWLMLKCAFCLCLLSPDLLSLFFNLPYVPMYLVLNFSKRRLDQIQLERLRYSCIEKRRSTLALYLNSVQQFMSMANGFQFICALANGWPRLAASYHSNWS